MEILPIIVFSSLFVAVLSSLAPKPGKTPEQDFGDAIAKFLSKGVKVRIEKDDR